MATSFLAPLAAIGAQLTSQVLIRPRSIGPFVADVTIEETHRDKLTLTTHPVEQGANITDHSYKEPAELTIRCGFSNSSPAANGLGGVIGGAIGGFTGNVVGGALGEIAGGIGGSIIGNLITGGSNDYATSVYQSFLALQATREPFNVLTGKRSYQNMVITLLQTTTDQRSEDSLFLTVECREIIIATTQVVAVGSASNMASPQLNGATQTVGAKSTTPGTNFNATAVPQ